MRVASSVLMALALVAAPLPGQGGAFVVRLGNDTVFVESYTRTSERLEGDQISRTARLTTLRHFTAEFDKRGTLTSFELTGRPAGSGVNALLQSVRATFGGDTAAVQLTVGDSTRTQRLAVPVGTLPYINFSYALVEVATQRARAAGSDAYTFDMLPLGAAAPFTVTLKRVGADSMAIEFFPGNPVKLRVAADGRVLGANGFETTQKVLVDRVPSVDMQALAAAFASRPLGQLSPLDSVQASIAGASVAVKYSRPSRRGRAIFGGIVPWNQVWRTGANAATSFKTSADLVMGGKTIPAGAYTLWTLPSPTGLKLIVNKETGQWGTDYHPDSDFVRLDMTVEQLPQPIEQFTIAIEPRGKGGVLQLAWENTRASIAFAKK